MRLRCGGMLLLGVVIATSPAFADYTVMGAGLASCSTWTQDRKRQTIDAKQIEQWMLGFLSGAGYVGAPRYDPLNGLDAQAVLSWVDNYCSAHSLKSLSAAGYSFIEAHPR